MPMVKKSITVTDQQEQWIQSQLATGNYATDSEVVREAIREKQLRSAEVEAIRTALMEGERSDLSDRTPEDVRATVQKRLKKNGQLPPA